MSGYICKHIHINVSSQLCKLSLLVKAKAYQPSPPRHSIRLLCTILRLANWCVCMVCLLTTALVLRTSYTVMHHIHIKQIKNAVFVVVVVYPRIFDWKVFKPFYLRWVRVYRIFPSHSIVSAIFIQFFKRCWHF